MKKPASKTSPYPTRARRAVPNALPSKKAPAAKPTTFPLHLSKNDIEDMRAYFRDTLDYSGFQDLAVLQSFLSFQKALTDRRDVVLQEISATDIKGCIHVTAAFITSDDKAIASLVRSTRAAVSKILELFDAGGRTDVDGNFIHLSTGPEDMIPNHVAYTVCLRIPEGLSPAYVRLIADTFFSELSTAY